MMRALRVGVVLLLSACSPLQLPFAPVTTLSEIQHQSTSGDLIYASGTDGKHIYIFSYPQGKLVSRIVAPAGTIALQGLCADSSGNVFATSVSKPKTGITYGYVYEYAHGGTKILKSHAFSEDRPFGCSVDPKSATLAVATAGLSSRGGTLTTFASGSSRGQQYYSSNIRDFYYCAYDGRGDLFVNGRGNGAQMYLNETQKGKTDLRELSLDKYVSVSGMGELQWDGSHLTLEDLTAGAIYRLSVSGSKATVIGTTHLYRWNGSGLSTIANGTVFVPTGVSETKIGFWKYPVGGKAVKAISSPSLVGLTFSAAKQQ